MVFYAKIMTCPLLCLFTIFKKLDISDLPFNLPIIRPILRSHTLWTLKVAFYAENFSSFLFQDCMLKEQHSLFSLFIRF